MKYSFLLLLPVLFLGHDNSDSFDKSYQKSVNLETIYHRNQSVSSIVKSKKFSQDILKINPEDSDNQQVIWQKRDKINWDKVNYLVCEIYHSNEFSGVINVNFFKMKSKDSKVVTKSEQLSFNPQISAKIGILPDLKTQLIFPLSYLDGQNIFLDRYPRQLKGTVLGNRIDKENISKITLNFAPYQEPYFTPSFEIASVKFTESLPKKYSAPNTPFVDKFGQWARKEWPGKIKKKQGLKKMNDSLLNIARTATLPEQWSKYGGWKKKRFKATGYFHTHHDGDRWWLVDPKGYAFLSAGVDGIAPGVSGMVENQENLLEWLPKKNDSLYGDAVNENDGKTMVDYYEANLMRTFGNQWEAKWDTITAGLMREYGLNTIANWSDLRFARKVKKPYVLPLRDFPSTETKLYRDFPDVYAPEYRKKARKFASQLEIFKNDPYLIGYFLNNEPHWGFGKHNVAFEMFATNQQSYTKDRFVEWIAARYKNNIAAFNDAWKLNLQGYEELKNSIIEEIPNETARKDFYRFSEKMVEQYIDVPCDEVEKIDSNHLNLGMRYSSISSDLMYKAGERFDVFSINGYSNPGPPNTAKIAQRSGKPVMIGEFHFGAVDRGLPATGIKAALNQKARGTAYRYYVEQGLSRPELIGIHYFTWTDQSIIGRFDGENYNIGFIDISNRPYPELTQAATKTNRRIYEVATGEVKPFDQTIEKIPPVHY